MAKDNKGLPDIELVPKKKKKPKSGRDETAQSLLRRVKRNAQHKQAAKKTREAPKQPVEKLAKIVDGPATATSRYNKLVKKVSKMTDVQRLKKMIYNRNYRLRKAFEKEHPEYAHDRRISKTEGIIMFPPLEDLRVVTQAAFKKLNKIGDHDKLVEELRKIIINTTRRKNAPKTIGDFSNREQDYLQNAVNALKEALSNWGDDLLSAKLKGAFDNITVVDINNIFETIPSYWAISEGYYYAVADFDNFMEEIYTVIERNGTVLTDMEKEELADRLFHNDPRTHSA